MASYLAMVRLENPEAPRVAGAACTSLVRRTRPWLTAAVILALSCLLPAPAHALDEVIDRTAIGKLIDQLSRMKEQLDELRTANRFLQDQLNAVGRMGQIAVPMLNMDRMASRLRQDAQCLAPDLSKLMPDVEFDDVNWGSICAAGGAYRKSLWMDPATIRNKSWEKQDEMRRMLDRRRINMGVDVASKGIGQGDIAVKEAERLGQAADDLKAAADTAATENERLAVIAQGAVLQARANAQNALVLAHLLKVQSTWFALTALPPESTLAKEDAQ